jgi:NTE family protein
MARKEASKRRRKRPSGRRPDRNAPRYPPAVVVLSGGAPNGALIAGALAAIYRKGKTFSTLYTSGAGALMGMLFKAPKGPGMTPDKALEQLLNFGVEDAIYQMFPVGYKTFFKCGPFTNAWIKMAQALKVPIRDQGDKPRRIYNDLVDFWFALTCPTDLTFRNQGLCAHPPFLRSFVDFDLLNSPATPGQFYMNAYSIEDGKMVEFDRKSATLTPQHFNAALSYPFIYAPTRIGNKHYFEGGCYDPLNLTTLADHIEADENFARTVVLMDILGPLRKMLVRVPENLWDAYGISILLPVVALAEKNEALFGERLKDINAKRPGREVKLKKIEFNIKPEFGPDLADWSRSNMKRCWEIGVKAGEDFVAVRENSVDLPDHEEGNSEPALTTATPSTPATDILGAAKAIRRAAKTFTRNLLTTLEPS